MSIDPKRLVTLIERSGAEVRLSEIDALCAQQADVIGGETSAPDVTAGLGLALSKGWLQFDGLRVSVSPSGRRALSG
jgi:hypothetical protein